MSEELTSADTEPLSSTPLPPLPPSSSNRAFQLNTGEDGNQVPSESSTEPIAKLEEEDEKVEKEALEHKDISIISGSQSTKLNQDVRQDSNVELSPAPSSALSQECTKSAVLATYAQIRPDPEAFLPKKTKKQDQTLMSSPFIEALAPAKPNQNNNNNATKSSFTSPKSTGNKFTPRSPADYKYVEYSERLEDITDTQLRRAAERRVARIQETDTSEEQALLTSNRLNLQDENELNEDDTDELSVRLRQIDFQLGLVASSPKPKVSLPKASVVLSPYRGAPIMTPSRVILSPLHPVREAEIEADARVYSGSPSKERRLFGFHDNLSPSNRYQQPDSPKSELAKIGPGSPHRVHLRALAISAERAGAKVVDVEPFPVYAPTARVVDYTTFSDIPPIQTIANLVPTITSSTSREVLLGLALHAETLSNLEKLESQVNDVIKEESNRIHLF